MLCPGDKCRHYWYQTIYQRKCFYEKQCWRGHVDALWAMIRLLVRVR